MRHEMNMLKWKYSFVSHQSLLIHWCWVNIWAITCLLIHIDFWDCNTLISFIILCMLSSCAAFLIWNKRQDCSVKLQCPLASSTLIRYHVPTQNERDCNFCSLQSSFCSSSACGCCEYSFIITISFSKALWFKCSKSLFFPHLTLWPRF